MLQQYYDFTKTNTMFFISNFLLQSNIVTCLNTTLSQYFFAPLICIFAVSQPKCTNYILLYMSILLQWVDNVHENVMHPSGKYGQHLAGIKVLQTSQVTSTSKWPIWRLVTLGQRSA